MCLSGDASGKRDKLRMGKRVKNEGDLWKEPEK